MQTVNIKHVAGVIGSLVDQICDEDIHHSRRLAVMAWRVGRCLQLDDADLEDLLIAALLHDCGVSSPAEYLKTVSCYNWQGEDEHCHRGAAFIKSCTLLSEYSNMVRYHHTPWAQLHPLNIAERHKLFANILYCVDRSYVGYHAICRAMGDDNVINHKSEILAGFRHLPKDAVAPDVYEAFLHVARTDGFWISLYPNFLDAALSPLHLKPGHERPATLAQMRNVGTLISRLVDIKSHFTHDHSERVSVIAVDLAERLGLDATTTKELELAALLHDVGKQSAPERVLSKPGALDDKERAIIKRHTIGSEMVLKMLFPEHRLVTWAANHHEKLDGSGYPFGLSGDELDIPSRILTVSDIFQALTQERPYRGRMSCDDAMDLMGTMVAKGELDAQVFQALNSNAALLYELSIQ